MSDPVSVTWSVNLIPYSSNTFTGRLDYDPLTEPERYGADYAEWTASVMLGFETARDEIRSGVRSVTGRTSPLTSEESDTLGEGDKKVAEDVLKRELGAVEESSEDSGSAPWQRKDVEKSEPWKQGGPVKKPKKIEWN